MPSNVYLLENAADKLGSLLAEVVFVGGSTLDLLVTDEAAPPIRATVDVDVIADIPTYPDHVAFSDRLRKLGFSEDVREGAPTCRWVHKDLTLDVMPIESKVLGFTNRWYRGALQTARPTTLPSGTTIRLITAPFFLGTKMEAFRERGEGDFFASHDLEDFIAVVEGRKSLLDEIKSAPRGLIIYLAEAATELLATARFRDALPGYMLGDAISQQRVAVVIETLSKLATF